MQADNTTVKKTSWGRGKCLKEIADRVLRVASNLVRLHKVAKETASLAASNQQAFNSLK